MAETKSSRVFTVGATPPEKLAYALARYSRSPDSIAASMEWVRTHDSSKFLESFYFQYGHASIADLGHLALCFEGISELAAVEIEDEQLWDGQARSSRYQDFSRSGFVTPPEFTAEEASRYQAAGGKLLAGYKDIHVAAFAHLREKLPRPEGMKPDAYERNLAARAFDVARYLLFFGIPTGVGQLTSIRTLEQQICRLKSSEYAEVRELGTETAAACALPPSVVWREGQAEEPVAPTLAKYVEPDPFPPAARARLRAWAAQNLPAPAGAPPETVDLLRPQDTLSDIAATLLYPVTGRPFRELLEIVSGWSRSRQSEIIDVALESRGKRDELLREFRGGPYVYDIVMDIGAYRDLHRHRRCQQFRQSFTSALGFETPALIDEAGLTASFTAKINEALAVLDTLPPPAAHYLLPFAMRSRFLFKMDFAEVEYISKLRSGIKGHFSYRNIAWLMKQKMDALDPELGRLIQATPPWIEDPLVR